MGQVISHEELIEALGTTWEASWEDNEPGQQLLVLPILPNVRK
jgi:hypothetical protein